MPDEGKHELAIGVVVAVGNALATSISPEAGAMATLASPFAIAGLKSISATIGSRRQEHAVETLLDGAEAYGAETLEDFVTFVEAAVSDEERQELLARTLTIASDTALRDKRRALGRALAAAASDTGTKVDTEMLFILVLSDLDEPHVRLLRLMSTEPPHLDAVNRQMKAVGQPVVRQWHPSDLIEQDPGLGDVIYGLLPVLARHQLISGGYDVLTRAGHEPEYTITSYGEFFLERLAEPE